MLLKTLPGFTIIIILTLSGCLFWDISSNDELTFKQYTINPEYTDLSVQDGICYLSAGPNGLRVFDMNDPAAPEELAGFYDFYLDEVLVHTVVSENLALAITDKRSYLLNISNPHSVSSVYIYDEKMKTTVCNGGYAYICGSDFIIIDISDPGNPYETGRIESLTGTTLIVPDEYAYLAGDTGLHILDVEDPSNPVITASLDISIEGSLHIQGDYLSFKDGGYLKVVDISNKEAPDLIDSGYAPGGDSVFFIKNSALVFISGDGTSSNIYRIELTDPQRPDITDTIALYSCDPENFLVTEPGNLLVGAITTGPFSSGMYIIESSPAGSLTLLNRILTEAPVLGGPIHILSLATEGNMVYFLAEEGIGSFTLARYHYE